jgi:8-oxo-dGTP pyrophosphatase MutT (NUDIX family)
VGRDDFELGDGRPDIAAAGGVLVRTGEQGREVAVIHRPKYMDWSLPKGKLEPDEGWLEAALREVEEETGYRCKPSVELPRVSYLDRKGRRKLVRYWLMERVSGEFEPHGEVDELRWLDREAAEQLLTYPHDRELVRKALRRHRWRRLIGALGPVTGRA